MIPDKTHNGKQENRANKVDPAHLRDSFLSTVAVDGISKLRRWRNQWYFWSNGRYTALTDEDVRCKIQTSIESECSDVTKTAVTNVLETVKAACLVQSTSEPHSYIAQAPEKLVGGIVCLRDRYASVEMLENGDAIKSTPAFFNLNATEFDYKHPSECSDPTNWLNFLDRSMPDKEAQRTLQQWFGYCLTLSMTQHKMLFLLGPKRSGKGTICRILNALVGSKNCTGSTLSQLAGNFGMWPMIGSQLCVIADARLTGQRNQGVIVERLLSISGDDIHTIDRKHSEEWTGRINTRVMICSNEMPRLNDASGALASRFIILETPNSFFGKEDLELEEKLRSELLGIFWWAIDGLSDLRESTRLHIPQSSLDFSRDLESLSSPAKTFFNEMCEFSTDSWVSTEDLFACYTEWCGSEGIARPTTKAVFIRDFKAAVQCKVTRRRDNNNKQFRLIEGIRIL